MVHRVNKAGRAHGGQHWTKKQENKERKRGKEMTKEGKIKSNKQIKKEKRSKTEVKTELAACCNMYCHFLLLKTN
jgi:hypothetical protein